MPLACRAVFSHPRTVTLPPAIGRASTALTRSSGGSGTMSRTQACRRAADLQTPRYWETVEGVSRGPTDRLASSVRMPHESVLWTDLLSQGAYGVPSL